MEENKRVVLTLFEALNARDLDVWSRQLEDDFTAEYPGMPIRDKTQSRMFNQSFVTAFPDVHFVIHHVLAEGDRVLAHWTAMGSQTERLATVSGETLPPSGNTVTIKGVLLAEIREGRITRGYWYWDQLSLLVNLGIMEQPGFFFPVEGF